MKYNTIGIIQARMGSSRLPGKMSAKLDNFSILEWVINRVSKAALIDRVILATSTLPIDDCLCNIANDLGILVFRGSEKDVLSRFGECSKLYKSNSIVRICADNPFIDPSELNRLVNFFHNNKLDYAFNHQSRLDNGIADGFGAEILSNSALKLIIASNPSQSQCEHVTKFIWDNPNLFNFSAVEVPSYLNYPNLRFDVDQYNDLNYLKSLVECGIGVDSPASEIINVALSNPLLPKDSLSSEIDKCLRSLFPLCRSITGNNNRKTLKILSKIIPLSTHEVCSGTEVFDWTIPSEWNIRNAFIADENGRKIIDFESSNLHVLSYSQPINKFIDWDILSQHLFSDKEKPFSVPYRTSYYSENWGFCVNREQYESLANHSGMFHVYIDSDFSNGSLTYGQFVVPGKSSREVLISCYICHPSMANDSLSGVVLTAFLARHISSLNNRHWTYRFIFVPETIGALTYLHQNREVVKNIEFGIVITTAGGPGPLSFKKSWDSSHFINSSARKVLSKHDPDFITYDFDIHGSDERQYSSPGFRINCISICKDKYYEYPQYHTSDDDLSFVTSQNMLKSYYAYIDLFAEIEHKTIYKRTQPHGEIMLSKHDLYPKVGGSLLPTNTEMSQLDLIMWVLFYTDGRLSVDCIAAKLSTKSSLIQKTYDILLSKSLVVEL